MTNRWTSNARWLIRAKTKCPSVDEMRSVHVDRRPPIYNALDRITRAKVVSPTEESLAAFQRANIPTSTLSVHIVLFYSDNTISADANKAFCEAGMRVSVSHPSVYCGKAYNVPTEYDVNRLRGCVHHVTQNDSFAQSFAFRRILSQTTTFPTTTVEWAALSEAATAVCNVQTHPDATGNRLHGIVWRVAEKGRRLPDTLQASSLTHNNNMQSAPIPSSTMPRSYAAALSASPNRQQPSYASAARAPPPA